MNPATPDESLPATRECHAAPSGDRLAPLHRLPIAGPVGGFFPLVVRSVLLGDGQTPTRIVVGEQLTDALAQILLRRGCGATAQVASASRRTISGAAETRPVDEIVLTVAVGLNDPNQAIPGDAVLTAALERMPTSDKFQSLGDGLSRRKP